MLSENQLQDVAALRGERFITWRREHHKVQDKTQELYDIANVLRRDVLQMTTAAGSGHPSSCLSCAEIMSALFFNEMSFDPKNPENPANDEFILSKGHAAPILYACLNRTGCISQDLLSLRKLSSPLEGHPIPNSLKWIKIASGSLGQGLAAGIGMAIASKISKKNFRVYVLCGDSEFGEGSNYEALQLASYYSLDNLCLIIDINRLGQTGETMLSYDLETYQKRISSFGWKTAVINGHNVSQILHSLKLAKSSYAPFAILAKTIKGKGVSFIESKNGWHGRALTKEELAKAFKEIPKTVFPPFIPKIPYSSPAEFNKAPVTKNLYTLGEEISTREAYGNALAKLALSDSSVIALDAEVSNSTFSQKVKSLTPKQFFNVFIAEQALVSISLGLSKKGFKPFASTFSAFLTRAHDQIRLAALSKANITFCGSHCGVSVGADGISQMGLEDIAMFRSLPNSIIFYPSDAVSAEKVTILASTLKGIKYIRTTRPKTPVIYKNSERFLLADFKILRKSSKDKLVLIGAGITLHESLKAYESLLKNKISSAVIDLYCIRPLNTEKLISFIQKHGNRVVIAEDHYKEGGIGEMLSSAFANTNIKIKHLAIREIPHSGTSQQLLEKYKIDARAIVKATKERV